MPINNNPQEFNRLLNILFFMKMNPHMPFINNGLQNPFYCGYNQNFNPNMSINNNNIKRIIILIIIIKT